MHINNFDKLKLEYQNLMKKCYSVDICPFYNIKSEFRIIYSSNKQYIYKKFDCKCNRFKFFSIDIVELTNNEYMVMEINSGVMMENLIKLEKNGVEIAKDIYGEAVKLMFKMDGEVEN